MGSIFLVFIHWCSLSIGIWVCPARFFGAQFPLDASFCQELFDEPRYEPLTGDDRESGDVPFASRNLKQGFLSSRGMCFEFPLADSAGRVAVRFAFLPFLITV